MSSNGDASHLGRDADALYSQSSNGDASHLGRDADALYSQSSNGDASHLRCKLAGITTLHSVRNIHLMQMMCNNLIVFF